MQIYLDNTNNTVTAVQSVASASTMISSLAREAIEYIESKFPPKFFVHTYIDTSQTVTQRSYNEKYSKTANKIPYPSITCTPVRSLDDPIGGMEKTRHLSSPNLYLRRDLSRTMNKLVVDPEKQFSIYYSSDYITTNFDFKIAVNTYIQNVNTAFYLKSRFQPGFWQYYNNRYIQSEIPKSLIMMIADLFGYDLNNSDDMDALRLYLIGTSKSEQAIQKKLNPGTGKQCFFINEKENLLTIFTDLDCPPSVIKDGQTEGEYIINFRLQVSAWIPNAYILHINKNTLNKLCNKTISALNDSDSSNSQLVVTSMPIRVNDHAETIYFYDANGQEQIGQKIYAELFTHELNKTFTSIQLGYLQNSKLSKELSKITVYAEDHDIDLSSIFHVEVISNSGTLKHNTLDGEGNPLPDDYTVDYKRRSIKIINEEYQQYDIYVMLYVNRLGYEAIKKAILEDKFYFNSNLLTYIYGKTVSSSGVEKPVKLVIKSFANSKEMQSSDNNFALRVNTAYGIGYVGLKDIKNNNKNAYRVCVGIDDKGKPIVKEIETK